MTMPRSSRLSRRGFLTATAAVALSARATGVSAVQLHPSLTGQIGLTTGSLSFQRRQKTLTIRSLPAFVRDELGMQLIDLNTNWLTAYTESYLQEARQAIEDAGCYVTNLKVNHDFGDPYSQNASESRQALVAGQEVIRAAKTLGARWVRFTIPQTAEKDPRGKLFAHRELARYAEQQGLRLLVENLGWMQKDPESLARLVEGIGRNASPGPDTGNWSDEVRYAALARSFPGAATCDFKVFELDEQGQHARYDIRGCFDVGWKAGFRGPWAIEHWNEDLKAFARETRQIRDQLQTWIQTSAGK